MSQDDADPRGSDAGAGTWSPVAQDYLKVIYSAQEWGGPGISVTDLADRMGVVASTASENVRRLTDQGLVLHEPYQRVHLTGRGRALAIGMVRRHRLLETYLLERLDFSWDEVHREAELLEHAVSDRLLEHLDRALGYPFRDPHGDPIPAADGTWVAPPMKSLDELEVGAAAPVARISDARSDMLRHLEGIGIVLDATVEVLERLDSIGTTRVRVTPPGRASVPVGSPSSARTPLPPPAPVVVDLGAVATAAVFVSDGTPGPWTGSGGETADVDATADRLPSDEVR